jgi:UDP-N-acetylglucosamine 2-epimerase (non-hydrolysing)
VLVLRKTTERLEGVEAGCARVCGTDPGRILAEADRLLDDAELYRWMAAVPNPYGDGRAAEGTVSLVGRFLARRRVQAVARASATA